MNNVNVTEHLNAMKSMLLPTPELADTLRKNACSYWNNQERLLDAMQTFANGWFERRHIGTHAALEAADRMCRAETPVDLAREYQAWVTGAMQRLTADGMACQQQCMTVVSAIAPSTDSLASTEKTSPSTTSQPVRAEAA